MMIEKFKEIFTGLSAYPTEEEKLGRVPLNKGQRAPRAGFENLHETLVGNKRSTNGGTWGDHGRTVGGGGSSGKGTCCAPNFL